MCLQRSPAAPRRPVCYLIEMLVREALAQFGRSARRIDHCPTAAQLPVVSLVSRDLTGNDDYRK